MKQKSKSFGGDVYTFKTQEETLDEDQIFHQNITKKIHKIAPFFRLEWISKGFVSWREICKWNGARLDGVFFLSSSLGLLAENKERDERGLSCETSFGRLEGKRNRKVAKVNFE